MVLFGEELEVTTSTVGLIAASLDEVSDSFLQWQNKIFNDSQYEWRKEHLAMSCKRVLTTLLPRVSPTRTRYALIATNSKWTAYFDNGKLGTDAASSMPVLAERLGCETMRITSVPHTYSKRPDAPATGRYGMQALEVYNSVSLTARSICSANDGGRWVFDESGEPYPFEDLEAYTRKRKRDRFTREMLIEYLTHFDARPFDESWYQHDAFLLKKCDRATGQPV